MRPFTSIFFFLLVLAGACSLHAAEAVYPTGSGATATYTLSGTSLPFGDTLTVTRELTNNGAFPLTGLYLSEHLPSGLQLADVSVTVNNTPVVPAYSALPQGSVITNCTTHHWTITQPGITALPAGQTLRLVLKLTFSQSGTYSLPLHTVAFSGNGNPYFATGDPVTVTITQIVDVTPPAAIGDLHVP